MNHIPWIQVTLGKIAMANRKWAEQNITLSYFQVSDWSNYEWQWKIPLTDLWSSSKYIRKVKKKKKKKKGHLGDGSLVFKQPAISFRASSTLYTVLCLVENFSKGCYTLGHGCLLSFLIHTLHSWHLIMKKQNRNGRKAQLKEDLNQRMTMLFEMLVSWQCKLDGSTQENPSYSTGPCRCAKFLLRCS